VELKSKHDYLYLPEWNNTRSIYKKLSDEFHVLTNAYSVELDSRTKLMLDHLILTIDEVDQSVDELQSKTERDSLTNSILQYLQNNESEYIHSLAKLSLSKKIEILKSIIKELHITERFYAAASKIFNYTEEKRHTKDQKKLIQLVQLEGEATAELPLSIMRIDSQDSFGLFFNRLCMLMGVADLVIDAKSDFNSNYIVLKPNFKFYRALVSIVIKEGIRLIWNFPHKFKFLMYCISFSVSLLTSRD